MFQHIPIFLMLLIHGIEEETQEVSKKIDMVQLSLYQISRSRAFPSTFNIQSLVLGTLMIEDK